MKKLIILLFTVGLFSCRKDPKNTIYTFKFKLQDGSYKTESFVLQENLNFSIKGSQGTYWIQSECDGDWEIIKYAVIDYEIISIKK